MLDVHRGYVAAGCDVISTNTWGLPSALLHGVAPLWNSTQPVHWMDLARRGLRLARQAVGEGGREDDCAVAFSINGDVDSEEGESTIRLLARLFAHEPPDLILLETLTVVRPSLFATVQSLLDTGLPVWLSFRRCRHGLCSVYGQHWGGPEGDAFGRAAARFEQMGIDALMINCIPPDHVDGMMSYLRDFTDLPLGVYPNLGYYTDEGWRFEPGVGSAEYAAMALRWRAEGAQIIGGCCGVGPAHVAAARALLEQTARGERRVGPGAAGRPGPRPAPARRAGARAGLDRSARAAAAPAAVSRPRRRPGRRRAFEREPDGVALSLRPGHRRPPALPGHRLRHGHPRHPARAQRGVARARDRHRRARRAQHRGKRPSQRRRRPHDRRADRHLPVGARGALRGHRRVRRADARRSRAARDRAPADRLLGPHAAGPGAHEARRRARARGRRVRHAAVDPLPAAQRRAARGRRAGGPSRRLRGLPVSGRARRPPRADRARRAAQRRRPPAHRRSRPARRLPAGDPPARGAGARSRRYGEL